MKKELKKKSTGFPALTNLFKQKLLPFNTNVTCCFNSNEIFTVEIPQNQHIFEGTLKAIEKLIFQVSFFYQ